MRSAGIALRLMLAIGRAGGTSQVVNVHLLSKPGYDRFRDLAPVATLTSAASLLIVKAA